MTIKLLFADDNIEVLKTVGRFMEKHGVSCVVASTRRAALGELSKEVFDVCLVDLDFVGDSTDCSGLLLASEIRRRYPTTRIIIYSALNQVRAAINAVQKADYYIEKPREGVEKILSVVIAMAFDNFIKSKSIDLANFVGDYQKTAIDVFEKFCREVVFNAALKAIPNRFEIMWSTPFGAGIEPEPKPMIETVGESVDLNVNGAFVVSENLVENNKRFELRIKIFNEKGGAWPLACSPELLTNAVFECFSRESFDRYIQATESMHNQRLGSHMALATALNTLSSDLKKVMDEVSDERLRETIWNLADDYNHLGLSLGCENKPDESRMSLNEVLSRVSDDLGLDLKVEQDIEMGRNSARGLEQLIKWLGKQGKPETIRVSREDQLIILEDQSETQELHRDMVYDATGLLEDDSDLLLFKGRFEVEQDHSIFVDRSQNKGHKFCICV